MLPQPHERKRIDPRRHSRHRGSFQAALRVQELRATAEELDKQAEKLGIDIPVLMEINCAEEEAKGGIYPAEAEDFFISLKKFPRLQVRGIMTMGPNLEDKEQLRPYFKNTKEIFDKIHTRYGFPGEPILSMGMSESFEEAIACGSTLVRVGRSMFVKN